MTDTKEMEDFKILANTMNIILRVPSFIMQTSKANLRLPIMLDPVPSNVHVLKFREERTSTS